VLIRRISHDAGALPDSVFAMPSVPAAEFGLHVRPLAPGVLRLEGPTHATLAVRQGNEFLLLEAPVNGAFTRAVLDTLARLHPRVPARRFVVSHHHGDHTGGVLRAFEAGMRAYAPASLTSHLAALGARWDGGVAGRRQITAVGDSLTLGSGSNRVVLKLMPNSHAWDLLVGYLPEHGIVFEADLQNSGATARRELRDFVQAQGWSARQLSGVHGPLVSWDEFIASVK
jgi:glyoxylase-like metal-dependent hydrolase (beta-lactamase superfamily II)